MSGADARDAMIDAAERMFAERGVDGVSMRDVAAAAGQRNNSAVAYHFGGRNGLALAVFRRRMAVIDAARRAYLDDLDRRGVRGDLRALVEAVVVPLADHLRAAEEGTYYAQFLAHVAPSVDVTTAELFDVSEANREVVARMVSALEHLGRKAATIRIDLMYTMAIAALATFEQRRNQQITTVRADFDEVVAQIIDMSVGALLAPSAERARARRSESRAPAKRTRE